MTTRLSSYFVWGPGFVRPDAHWMAGWQRRNTRTNQFDGFWEADTMEEAVQNLPYRVAVALMEKIKADVPVVHGASRYDHHGCRCDVCKAAKAAKNKRLRERRKEKVSGA